MSDINKHLLNTSKEWWKIMPCECILLIYSFLNLISSFGFLKSAFLLISCTNFMFFRVKEIYITTCSYTDIMMMRYDGICWYINPLISNNHGLPLFFLYLSMPPCHKKKQHIPFCILTKCQKSAFYSDT